MEMDKDQKLNDLFRQAQNDSPQVGFDEMKQSFLSQAVDPTFMDSATKTSNLFTIKTWTIMISTALSTGIIFAFLNGVFSDKPVSEEPFSRDSQPAPIELSSNELMLLELNESEWIHYDEIPSVYTPEFSQEEWVEKVKEPEKVKPQELVSVPLVFKEEKKEIEEYRFPMLTKEEKKMYAKQKALMIKSWVKRDKAQQFIPMGKLSYQGDSVSINAFYMAKAEVTNLEYRTFLFDLLEKGRKEDFLIAKPDQTLWAKDYPEYNQPMVELYFSHPAYKYYPVNNISRAGAEMYCEWLTTEVNEFLVSKKKPKIAQIRIPTNVEWDYAALGGNAANVYPWGGPYARNSKGCYLANFNPVGESPNEDGAMQTAAVYSYSPNGYGLFCMSGNIAEMVYDFEDNSKIGTKGGSFLSPKESLQINAPMEHIGIAEPNVEIGFRVVCSYLGATKWDMTWENARFKYQHKMGSYDENGNFRFPEFTEKEKKTYEKLKKELISKAGNYGDANYVSVKRDTLLMNQDSVHVKDVSIKSTEITNLEYRTFLFDLLEQNRKDDYLTAMPDEMVWVGDSNRFLEDHQNLYLSFPGYDNFPVVGVNEKGIKLYCEWVTREAQKTFDFKPGYIREIKMRIPLETEWERVASHNGKYKRYPWEGTDLTNQTGEFLANFYPEEGNYTKDGAFFTNTVKMYPASPNHSYGLMGNVSEITYNESGKLIAKGGSWQTRENALGIYYSESSQNHSVTNFNTGFRPVLVYTYHYSIERYNKYYPPEKN